MRFLIGIAHLALAIGLGAAPAADEVAVMASGAFTAPYNVLVAEWQRSTGHKVTTVFGASMGSAPTTIPNRLARGEQADVVILARSALDALAREGRIVNGSQVDLADSRIAMAVKSGSPLPAIATAEQFRQVVLNAKSIAYSESASGVYLSTELFPRLGIADAVASKSQMVSGRPVGEVVAAGGAEIGFQQLSELMAVKGITVVGPLPDSLQRITRFAAGIGAASRARTAASALIAFLASDQARETIRRAGLDPIIK